MGAVGFAAYEPKAELLPLNFHLSPLKTDDVEVAITHCGICHSDLHLIDNDWKQTRYPFVPGHEIIGMVIAKGDAVKDLELGQRVGIGWQCGACWKCAPCKAHKENCCIKEEGTCLGRNGGFANAIRIDHRFAFAIPESLSSAETAPLLCGGITVFSALIHHGKPPLSKVGVIGIGGLGHLALKFASAMGCDVTAFSTSPNKRAEAIKLGANHFFAEGPENLRAEEGTYDLILSTVNSDLPWQEWIRLLKPGGTLCFVGASPGKAAFGVFDLISREINICGSNTGNRRMIQEMLDFAGRHRIGAQIETYPLEQVNIALERLREGKTRYRAVLEMVT